MKQIQKEAFVGASYVERFEKNYKIRIPNEIKEPSDARFVPILHDSHASDKAISRAFEIINKFDDITEGIIKEYKKEPDILKSLNLKELITNFVEGHNSTEKLIRVYESFISYKNINPITYIYAKEHFNISKIFLDKIREINIESIKNKKLELDDETKEDFKFGVFVGLEPILVTTILSNFGRDNVALIQNYGKLIERYAHKIAKMYTKEYLEVTEINKPILTVENYSKLLSFIEAERNG